MTGATIDVQRPPEGWSHLRGPLLHLLVGFDAADDRYAPAVAPCDSGDLDDVLDVLASRGMRRTPAFVAVAGATRPRVVTHADGYAVITSTRGTLEVRAPHGRVWSDHLADEDVLTVAVRVWPSSVPRGPIVTVADDPVVEELPVVADTLDERVAGAYAFHPLAVRANGNVFAPDAPSLEEATSFWVEFKAARRVLRRQVPWLRRLLADVSPSSARRPAPRAARVLARA